MESIKQLSVFMAALVFICASGCAKDKPIKTDKADKATNDLAGRLMKASEIHALYAEAYAAASTA
jgi:outer membrane murein-binding lipoprotein Lpp